MLSSGFTYAPITQLGLVAIIASSIAASIFDVKYLFSIEVVPHLWRYFQFWRLLVWQTCYMNSTEVLQAGMVLYNLRVVERLWGSRKLASFLVSTLPYTSLLPPLILALIVRPLSLNTLNYLPAGPTAIIFALLAQFHGAIPSTYKYHISTATSAPSPSSSALPALRFSDKSITYFLALQLSLSQFPYSILPALTGWVIGQAWRAELLPGRASSWRVPSWVYGGDPRLEELRRQRAAALRRRRRHGDAADADVSGRDAERFEGLRRRLEGESRAAASASAAGPAARTASTTSGGPSSSSPSSAAADTAQPRPLAGQILDRFRGEF